MIHLRKRISTLIIISLTMVIIYSAQAFTPYNDLDMKVYHELIEKILKDPSQNTNTYARLRRYYSNIDDYDPDPVEIIAELNALAPEIKSKSTNRSDIIKFDRFQKLILTHFANIEVMKAALLISQKHPNLVNQSQLITIYKKLVSSIALRGSGKSFYTAYNLYTLSEETELLKALKVTLLDKEMKSKANKHYAIYKVYDPMIDAEKLIYANITEPTNALVKKIEHQDAIDKKPLIIGK